MKKLGLFLMVFGIGMFHFSTTAQTLTPEFEFQLYFEDAAGNRDTITLGYDTLATYGIDEEFGEENILGVPWKTEGLEVRITNVEYFILPTSAYQTKKQIVYYECGDPNKQQIDIFTKNWPITMTWDSSNDDYDCVKESILTSCAPGGWFDVCGPSNLYILNLFDTPEWSGVEMETFTSNTYSNDLSWGYLNSNGDTISSFWQIFWDKQYNIELETYPKADEIKLFPNPFEYSFSLSVDIPFEQLRLYDITGRERQLKQEGEIYTPIHCEAGVYFLAILGNNENRYYKIIKL